MTGTTISGYVHHAGDQFVFKGGIAWNHTCFVWEPLAGGVAGNPDYYSVSKTWFSGGAWSRPVFDGEHLLATLLYTGAAGAGAIHDIVYDNLEFKRVSGAGDNQGLLTFFQCHDITETNCLFDDWLCTAGTDKYHGALIWNNAASAYAITNMLTVGCEIHNAANGASGQWSGEAVGFGGVISNCFIHDTASAILFAQAAYGTTFSNIDYPYSNFDPGAHCNGFYMDNGNGNTLPANGLKLKCGYCTFVNSGNAANMAYPNVERYNCEIYNCLYTGNISAQQCIGVDTYNNGFTLIPPFFYPPNVSYDGSGNYTVTGLTSGNLYYWTKAAHDVACAGLTNTGFFTASATSQVITGIPSGTVTAAVAPAVMNSCEIYNCTMVLTNLPLAANGIITASRTGLMISNFFLTNVLAIGASASLTPTHGTNLFIFNEQTDNNKALTPSVATTQGYLGPTFAPTLPSFAYAGADLSGLGLGINWTNIGWRSLAMQPQTGSVLIRYNPSGPIIRNGGNITIFQ
jgi:hypothetical protein